MTKRLNNLVKEIALASALVGVLYSGSGCYNFETDVKPQERNIPAMSGYSQKEVEPNKRISVEGVDFSENGSEVRARISRYAGEKLGFDLVVEDINGNREKVYAPINEIEDFGNGKIYAISDIPKGKKVIGANPIIIGRDGKINASEYFPFEDVSKKK